MVSLLASYAEYRLGLEVAIAFGTTFANSISLALSLALNTLATSETFDVELVVINRLGLRFPFPFSFGLEKVTLLA